MKILFLGDIVGRAGRTLVLDHLPRLRERLAVDFVVVNAENAAHGFGVTRKICEALFAAGADVLTTGNHVWDQREILSHIDGEPRLVRPVNYPAGTPGRGATLVEARGGGRVLVVQAVGRLFMDLVDDPFTTVPAAIGDAVLGRDVDAVLVDFHAEATSEKAALAHALDGRVSAVVGTHTHVPTADAQVLPGGTAYITDLGMCGDYDSVIGMEKDAAIARFTSKVPGERLQPARGRATLCGVLVETDPATGLARGIRPLRFGGRLGPAWPDVSEGADADDLSD